MEWRSRVLPRSHIVLADFEVLFRAQRIPSGLVWRGLRRSVLVWFAGGLWLRGAWCAGRFRRGLLPRILRVAIPGHEEQE